MCRPRSELTEGSAPAAHLPALNDNPTPSGVSRVDVTLERNPILNGEKVLKKHEPAPVFRVGERQ